MMRNKLMKSKKSMSLRKLNVITIDEMKECIQEWMAQCTSPINLAMTYAECKAELDYQLRFCMSMFYEGEGGQDA